MKNNLMKKGKSKKQADYKSDFDEFVSDPKRKKLLDKKYKELCLSEVVSTLMQREAMSVRALAKEIGMSPTVIQGIKSNKHSNITLNTFFDITEALGATIKIEIGDALITLKE